ncbi:MAG: N-formylglutamate amidohydrolase [Betaproteobacteria bacterium]
MSELIRHLPGSSALVLDSPHSGTYYPVDFGHACDLQTLRRAEDTHVDQLYAFAPSLGVHWIEARFPRSYLDANRALAEIDESLMDGPWPGERPRTDSERAKVRLGKGLIWRQTDEGLPLYQRLLGVDEVRSRIERCWQPYHAAVAQALNAAHQAHGYSLHINCHSMPAVAASHATDFPGLVHPDFVVGNRDHSTSSAALADWLCEQLRAMGYVVWLNHPYKGVELVRRYGQPQAHRHSLQLEINRRLYMDEQSLEIHPGFEHLQAHLRQLVERLLALDPRQL